MAKSKSKRPKGRSLHVGLNGVDPKQYDGWDGKLAACEFDAKDMKAIAAARGFKTQTLLTKQATHQAVVQAIADAAASMRSGDTFFLTYSGHGGQVDDENGSDEEDGKDETWVLYDRELVDDELYAVWGRFERGVRIVMLSDSCHSGTMARVVSQLAATEPFTAEMRGIAKATVPRFRLMPEAVAKVVHRQKKSLFKQVQKDHAAGERVAIGASVLLISGCQDNQLSSDGDRNGLFTATLRKVWNDGRFRRGYRPFYKEIARQMPPWQSPNYFRVGTIDAHFERQQPFTV